MIPDHIIEKAAKAKFKRAYTDDVFSWDDAPEHVRQYCRDAVVRAITPVYADIQADAQAGVAAPDATHWIELDTYGGELHQKLTCTAAPGAPCRRRPRDNDRECWNEDDPDLIDGDCWAVEWISATGWDDGTRAPEGITFPRIPVSVSYDECVFLEPVDSHPTLPYCIGPAMTRIALAALTDVVEVFERVTVGRLVAPAWASAGCAPGSAKSRTTPNS